MLNAEAFADMCHSSWTFTLTYFFDMIRITREYSVYMNKRF